jgi:hypothetical protein
MVESKMGERTIRVAALLSSAVVVAGLTGACTVAKAAAAPAAPTLSVRISLPRVTLVAGTSEKGSLVVRNAGPATVNLNTGCAPMFAVALSNARVTQDTPFPEVCSIRAVLLRPGVTKLPFTLTTTYTSCIPASAESQNPGNDQQKCDVHTGGPPPLPLGTYRAKMVSSEQTALPSPPPVRVHLVGKRRSM